MKPVPRQQDTSKRAWCLCLPLGHFGDFSHSTIASTSVECLAVHLFRQHFNQQEIKVGDIWPSLAMD
jgi:hypothetical protein